MSTLAKTKDATSAGTEAEKSYRKPKYDVYTHDQGYELYIQMPGVEAEGVNVSIHENVLTVLGERKSTIRESWKVIHEELPGYDYRASFNLGSDLDLDAITAKVEDGILKIGLSKLPEAKPRKIKVS